MSNSKTKIRMKKVSYHLKNVVLVAAIGFFLFNAFKEFSTTLNIKHQLEDAQQLAREIHEETETLQKQKEMLQDPNYAINYARGKLLISQDGEQIFSLDENK